MGCTLTWHAQYTHNNLQASIQWQNLQQSNCLLALSLTCDLRRGVDLLYLTFGAAPSVFQASHLATQHLDGLNVLQQALLRLPQTPPTFSPG